ncbi:MAG TPA: 50S ribosomal protein L28 [Chlamydiales bacterium]|nr:50S ribosomal protein L28 [Chlamydiales bacterium]
MPRTCILTGRKPSFGRSYTLRGIAKKKKGIGLKITGCTNRRFNPNLQEKRIYNPDDGRFYTLRLSTAALRTVDKKGIGAVVRDLKKQGKL